MYSTFMYSFIQLVIQTAVAKYFVHNLGRTINIILFNFIVYEGKRSLWTPIV